MKGWLLAVGFFVCSAVSPAAQTPASAVPAVPALAGEGVKVLGCSLEYSLQSAVADKLHIDFINMNSLPVTHLRFRITVAQNTFPVIDVGSFRPNLKIHQDLDPPATRVGVVPGANSDEMNCSVDAYTLTDGSEWISPELQAELNGQ